MAEYLPAFAHYEEYRGRMAKLWPESTRPAVLATQTTSKAQSSSSASGDRVFDSHAGSRDGYPAGDRPFVSAYANHAYIDSAPACLLHPVKPNREEIIRKKVKYGKR